MVVVYFFNSAKTAVMVFGFDAHVNDVRDIKESLIRLFRDIMQVNMTHHDIIFVSKLGIDVAYKRPVLVRLSRPYLKDQVLLKRRKLRGLRYKVENYLRKDLVDKQRELLPVMKFYRKIGHYAIIREGLLLVDGKVLQNTDHLIKRLQQAKEASLIPDLVSPVFVSRRTYGSLLHPSYHPINRTDDRFFDLYDDLIRRAPRTSPSFYLRTTPRLEVLRPPRYLDDDHQHTSEEV